MEYPFEDKTFVLSLKKQYSVSNPEQLMLSALGLLTTVKLYNGVNTATSYAWPWKEICINVNTFYPYCGIGSLEQVVLSAVERCVSWKQHNNDTTLTPIYI